jgi:hypothetical protein
VQGIVGRFGTVEWVCKSRSQAMTIEISPSLAIRTATYARSVGQRERSRCLRLRRTLRRLPSVLPCFGVGPAVPSAHGVVPFLP